MHFASLLACQTFVNRDHQHILDMSILVSLYPREESLRANFAKFASRYSFMFQSELAPTTALSLLQLVVRTRDS